MSLEWNSISSLPNTFWGPPLRLILKRKQNNKNSLPCLLPYNLLCVFNLRNQILSLRTCRVYYVCQVLICQAWVPNTFFFSIYAVVYVSTIYLVCLSVCLSTHPSIHPSIHLHHHLSCFHHNCSSQSLGGSLSRSCTICTLTTFPLVQAAHGCPHT